MAARDWCPCGRPWSEPWGGPWGGRLPVATAGQLRQDTQLPWVAIAQAHASMSNPWAWASLQAKVGGSG